MTKKFKAILFINIYCLCDTFDNINAKYAMAKGVAVLDLTLARIVFNFISACLFVYFLKQSILGAVPARHKFALTYRSLFLVIG